jgi:phage head maturation protease
VRRTDALGVIRDAAAGGREISGLAVPYGAISNETELSPGGAIVREALAPAAMRDSVARWMARQDGARMAFRPAHGERPVGTVTELRDTPEGVTFRATIFETPRGDEYLSDVRAGLNGVSIEFNPNPKSSVRMKDGTLLHRSARLAAIAGSVDPAYDGARVSLRDMEALMAENETPVPEPTPEPEPVPTPEPEPLAQRQAAERATASQFAASIAITRPELVYTRDADHNYMHDTWLIGGSYVPNGRAEAGERVRRHQMHLQETAVRMEREAYSRVFDPGTSQRASDVLSSEIPGAYPNDYFPGLLTPRILKGRPMGSALTRIPISDARPRIFPKVTTSGTVATFAEGVAPTATDIATTAVTTTPAAYGTYTDVSRQALDGGDPSVLAIIFQDLLEAYAQASETAIKTAVEAGATASGTAITAATPWAGTLGNVVTYYGTRFKAAEYVFYPSALYSVLLAQGDTTGRPFMPQLGPTNSDGTVEAGAINGNVLGAQVRLSWASTANVVVTAVSTDYVIFESSVAQFTYDQVVGPQSVRVGLWAYLGIGTRLGGLKVTAA